MPRAPVISISHGGGPMPLLNDPSHAQITHSLRTRVPQLLKLNTSEEPRAIVVVTAHWSELGKVGVSSAERHGLLYDYHGFPAETYKLRYEASGDSEVAGMVGEVLKGEGLRVEMDDERGWDHGVFVPMLLINPKAHIPIVQVSVLSSEDPKEHFKIGKALSKLRDANIAIVGSGFASFHNLRLLFSGITYDPDFRKRNEAWSEELSAAVMERDVESRQKKLEGWRKFQGSSEAHPRGGAEHLLPLIACAGAGGEGEAKRYKDEFMGLDMWSYYWE
ncbi:hypothetical protein LTS18_004508 [Coniosporium uncinatum]|uniref:Uncharacterized protein n=1 Tax=Coniosporium uncinatum TaxID=93489 RepID=A0ACC3DS47_9PEZI|nr:hypothetical protein LTS18_004508 [Coniosporium uncinatum]